MDWDNFYQLSLTRILPISFAFVLAMLLTMTSGRIVRRILRVSRLAPTRQRLREERYQTLQGILGGIISLLAFTIATLFCVGLFVDLGTLVWVVGLFSAAFGLGVRPLISDVMTGIFFVFEDTLDVGEKVEILGIEGVVEDVNLRVVQLRGIAGELYVIPNGEIRIIRNFSRGKFSPADIILKIPTKDVQVALNILIPLADEALILLPNMIEPWIVLNDGGITGQTTELKISVKARFGKAAEMRPRLLALVQERLDIAGIPLAT